MMKTQPGVLASVPPIRWGRGSYLKGLLGVLMGLHALSPVGGPVGRPSSCPLMVRSLSAQGAYEGQFPSAWFEWSQTDFPHQVRTHHFTPEQRVLVNQLQQHAATQDIVYMQIDDYQHWGITDCLSHPGCCVIALKQTPYMMTTLIHEWGHLYFEQPDMKVSFSESHPRVDPECVGTGLFELANIITEWGISKWAAEVGLGIHQTLQPTHPNMAMPDFWSTAVLFLSPPHPNDMMGTLITGLIQLIRRVHEQQDVFRLIRRIDPTDQQLDQKETKASQHLCQSVVEQVAWLMGVVAPKQMLLLKIQIQRLMTSVKKAQHEWVAALQQRGIGPVGGKRERADRVMTHALTLLNEVYALSSHWCRTHAPEPYRRWWVPGQFDAQLQASDGAPGIWQVGFMPTKDQGRSVLNRPQGGPEQRRA